MSEKIEVRTHMVSSTFINEAQLPEEVVDDLDEYLDDLLKNKDRKSHASKLVGQIQEGEQLTMDFDHPKLKRFMGIQSGLCLDYVRRYVEISESGLFFRGRKIEVQPEEVWSVHSYAGDYNPLHDHYTASKQISELKPVNDLTNASGEQDGFLHFIIDATGIKEVEMLKLVQQVSYKPEVGKILIFPSWCSHMVSPFKGEGERRTVASNLNIKVHQDSNSINKK